MKKISIEPLRLRLYEAKRTGKSQAKIAEMLGLSPQGLSNILNDRTNITLRVIVRACEIFDCEIQDICKFEKGE